MAPTRAQMMAIKKQVEERSNEFHHLRAVTNVLCVDGKQRKAYTTGDADTFYTIPAYVIYKSRRVKGFLTREPLFPGYDTTMAWKFTATGEDRAAIPTAHVVRVVKQKQGRNWIVGCSCGWLAGLKLTKHEAITTAQTHEKVEAENERAYGTNAVG